MSSASDYDLQGCSTLCAGIREKEGQSVSALCSSPGKDALQRPPKGPVSEIFRINAAGLEVVKGKKRGETLLAALPKQMRPNALPPLLLHSHFCPSTHLSPTLGSIPFRPLHPYSFIQSVTGSHTPSFLLSLDCLSPHSPRPSLQSLH